VQTVAIIGGGPAGAVAAERLAGGNPQLRVLVFEERLGWEKPCGGGLPYKVLQRYPFLLGATSPRSLIHDTEFVAASGEAVRLRLSRPVAVYSRSVLNRLLLDRARAAGAEVIPERVLGFERTPQGWVIQSRAGHNTHREHTAHDGHDDRDRQDDRGGRYVCDHLVLAAGARTSLRQRLAPPLAAHDLILTFGYYLPRADDLLRVQFLEGCEGYAWAFPRPDHLSVGVAAKLGELSMTALKQRLRAFMLRFGYGEPGDAQVFSHVLPGLGSQSWKCLPLAGPGWSMAGDAAGLADPITGEGIYLAMRSGELVADAILAGAPETYPKRVWRDFGRKLAFGSHLVRRFYQGTFLGEVCTTRMIQYARRSQAFRTLMQDLIDGSQSYPTLIFRVGWALACLAGSLAFGSQDLPPGMEVAD
jgi:flavin-dependent dehydrogenase